VKVRLPVRPEVQAVFEAMLKQRKKCFTVGLLVQRFATVCDEWTADVFAVNS
jgi:hypothetical protein